MGNCWGWHQCYPRPRYRTNCTAFQFLITSSFLLLFLHVPWSPRLALPSFPLGPPEEHPEPSTADAPAESGGVIWGNSQVGISSPSPGLASLQANPPWRMTEVTEVVEPSTSGEVQEQGYTSHITRNLAQILAWPKRLFNHPVFSGRKWLQRQNTM